MKDQQRKEEARLRAQAYAPAPGDSRVLYGHVSASLMLVIVFLVGLVAESMRETFAIIVGRY